MEGYYRSPTIRGDQIVFAADNGLWKIFRGGGRAERLTSTLAKAENPYFSPDGKWIAFTGYDEGHAEVYRMPQGGGPSERLTFTSAGASVVGWNKDGHILFTSNIGQPVFLKKLFTLNPETKKFSQIKCGPANNISYDAKETANVIQRHGYGYASWKRYRGGTAAELWIDPKNTGSYNKLISLESNCLNPRWIKNRIYFISDHEGHGNIYSCTPIGKDLKRHTHGENFFVRSFQFDGNSIVYNAGADLYIYDLLLDESKKIKISFQSAASHRARRFVEADELLTDFTLNPKGQKTAIISRGRPFAFANWEGAVRQYGKMDGVRYRHIAWHNDDKQLIIISDYKGEDCLELHDVDPLKKIKHFKGLDLGRIVSVHPSPCTDEVALTNHRCQLLIVDLKTKKLREVDHSEFWEISGVSWSPDGKWLAYDYRQSRHTTCLKLADLTKNKTHKITEPVLGDFHPSFDPDGKYLYFVSKRIYKPVYDNMQFELGFPKGMRPYLITLQKDTLSPFIPALSEDDKPTKKPKAKKGKQAPEDTPNVKIDLDGISDRIIEFPVAEGRYGSVVGLKNGKVLYASILQSQDREEPKHTGASLKIYDFQSQREQTLVNSVRSFDISLDHEWLLYKTDNRLRVVKAGEKPPEEDPSYKKGGWLDLDRVSISVDPHTEWSQIFDETWRLQKEFFWTEDMSKINWNGIYKRYRPLVDRIMSRDELSDLIAEMHGELGSSHAYVFGGDFPESIHYPQGSLGAQFEFNKKKGGYVLKSFDKGDVWNPRASSPLARPGVGIKEGDTLIAINGLSLDESISPEMRLVNQAGHELELTYKSGKSIKATTVKALMSSTAARYREWVDRNRAYVHKKTNGKVGYIHIPDMSTEGFSEFHRGFLAEIDRDALIVDVRYNGGGNVSPLILEKLSRKRLGVDKTRWFGEINYPEDSPQGPMVALTNEYAGSDGDMFSHSFKLLNLGPLIGKRTWGGVIGIWPRHSQLVDGGQTTQPEFSFWFHDVGWNIENYGTDPDIEVEITPQDYVNGVDPQLDRGIAEVKKIMKNFKPFAITKRPDLRAKKLPKVVGGK